MKLKLALLVILAAKLFAQTDTDVYNVESFVIKDSLTAQDPVEKNLGRYNNFEIHLNKGDKVAAKLIARRFAPLVLFVSPAGEKFVYNSENGSEIGFTREIGESGDWNLFVIGGAEDTGAYECRISFADSASVEFPEKTDLCGLLRFFAAHSRAEFAFIRENSDNAKKITLADKNFFVTNATPTKKNEFILTLASPDPEKEFDAVTDEIFSCFEDWNVKIGKRRKVKNAFEKTVSAIESGVREPRFIKAVLIENGGAKTIELKFGLLK